MAAGCTPVDHLPGALSAGPASASRTWTPTTGVPIRYVRDCPGELVHVDIKTLGKVPDGGGWKVLGRPEGGPSHKTGYEYVPSMVDDHSRVAYSEVLDSQDAQACAGFMLRAARWFTTWGYRIDRVMTNNAWAYRRNQAFADVLSEIGAAQKLIRPYRPQTNGKVERFHQTMPTTKSDSTTSPVFSVVGLSHPECVPRHLQSGLWKQNLVGMRCADTGLMASAETTRASASYSSGSPNCIPNRNGKGVWGS